MVLNINFKQNESQEESPGKYGITDSELAESFRKLQAKKDNKESMTVREQLRLGRLKKYGDKAQEKSKLTQKPKPSKAPDLPSLNNNPTPDTPHKIHQVIDSIYDGLTLIQACNKYNTSPKQFLKELEKTQNLALRTEFLNARIVLAEFYLERREQLENDLKSGKIDPSTYTCLSSDYKYLAGKLAPLAYGDKIKLDCTMTNSDTQPDSARLEELNKLINGGELKPIE